MESSDGSCSIEDDSEGTEESEESEDKESEEGEVGEESDDVSVQAVRNKKLIEPQRSFFMALL